VTPKLRDEWKKYINENFPDVKIHFVSTFDTLNEKVTKSQKRYVHATGIINLLKDMKSFSNNPSLENQWNSIISAISSRIEGDQNSSAISTEGLKDDSLFTIGFIGQPNVGKSSLINSIFGRKVVSASRTPGHTKHFQTLHLSAGIRVCDSPGLVFPSIIDKNLQILCGLYNIAQVKDPYGPILYFSKRIDLFKKLNIPRSQDPNQPNSVFYLCEEYAKKCGFYTSKAGRPDTYRVANLILRQVIDGKIVISWMPPDFKEDLDETFYERNSESSDISSESGISSEDEFEYSDEEEEIDEIKNFESKCQFSVFNEILE
jgi:ribosome biogenesis GTPase A